jgi:branched-chain amino acid transport system permease protein
MVSFILVITDILVFYAIYVIVTLALNEMYGYAGIPNFGLVFAVAGGAYITAFLPGRLAAWIFHIDPSLDFIHDNLYIMSMINANLQSTPFLSIILLLLTLASAFLVGAFLGLIASYPAIRLRVEYLMMVLIAMAEAVRIIGYNYEPIAGGTLGVSIPNMLGWIKLPIWMKDLMFIGGMATLVAFSMCILLASPLGRLLRAIREDETVAESLGKDTVKLKMAVMLVGSGVAALGGAIHSLYLGATVPQGYTRDDWTFWPWLMLMVGGKGNNRGVIVGAFIVVLIRRIINAYKYAVAPLFPFDPAWLERILLGVTLIVMMAVRPQGIIPEKPIYLRGIHDIRVNGETPMIRPASESKLHVMFRSLKKFTQVLKRKILHFYEQVRERMKPIQRSGV